MPAIDHLECSRCHQAVSSETPQTVCPACAGSLCVRYSAADLKRAKKPGPGAPASLWRYADVLPSRRHPALLVKEEADNPTGSFKPRGMSLAVTMVTR
jgi:threonine synthase